MRARADAAHAPANRSSAADVTRCGRWHAVARPAAMQDDPMPWRAVETPPRLLASCVDFAGVAAWVRSQA